jgi:hypothetical protein
LLRRLDADERAVLAEMLTASFESGVHQSLVAPHEAHIEPFKDGYEGTPFPRLRRSPQRLGLAPYAH